MYVFTPKIIKSGDFQKLPTPKKGCKHDRLHYTHPAHGFRLKLRLLEFLRFAVLRVKVEEALARWVSTVR